MLQVDEYVGKSCVVACEVASYVVPAEVLNLLVSERYHLLPHHRRHHHLLHPCL